MSASQAHDGYGLAMWEVIRWAVGAGFGVRVGLQDTTVLPDGSVSCGKGDLVAAAARIASSAGG